MADPRSWLSASELATMEVGAELAGSLLPDRLLLLDGDLGSGKTVLVKGVARGLGIAENEIHSPTFTLVHEHRGGLADLLHLDLYRLEPDQLEQIGWSELLERPGIKVVEWGERVKEPPEGAVRLRMTRISGRRRRIEVWDPRPAAAEVAAKVR